MTEKDLSPVDDDEADGANSACAELRAHAERQEGEKTKKGKTKTIEKKERTTGTFQDKEWSSSDWNCGEPRRGTSGETDRKTPFSEKESVQGCRRRSWAVDEDTRQRDVEPERQRMEVLQLASDQEACTSTP